jgi:protein-tyrosine phosphatase
LGNHAKNLGENIRAAAAQFQQFLDRRRVPLRVLPGADVRVEPDLVRKIRIGEVLTLANRRRHVLLELPHEVYVPLDRLLAELGSANLIGVLSHPERNRRILNRPDVLRPLVDRGCLLQVTAGSLMGTFGPQVMRFSEFLIEQGLVHFISTDAHGTKARPPLLNAAFQRITELVGRQTAVNLCCRHPATVANGGTVSPGCQRSEKSTWTEWLLQALCFRTCNYKTDIVKTCR